MKERVAARLTAVRGACEVSCAGARLVGRWGCGLEEEGKERLGGACRRREREREREREAWRLLWKGTEWGAGCVRMGDE